METVGAPELLIILVVCLLIFGGSKLPKLARSLGEAKAEFERSASGGSSSDPADVPVTMTKTELAQIFDQPGGAASQETGASGVAETPAERPPTESDAGPGR